MTRDQVAALGRSYEKSRSNQFLWMTPVAIGFVAIGLRMWRDGDPGGLLTVVFFGAFVPIAPMMILQGFKKGRYAGGVLEARTSPWEAVLRFAGLGMVSGGSLMGVYALGLSETGFLLLACGLFIGCLGLLSAVQAVKPGPILIVGPAGYLDRRMSREPIAWRDVESVDVAKVKTNRFLQLRVHDAPENRTLLRRVNSLFGFGGCTLDGSGLNCTTADILLAIHAHAPDLFSEVVAD